MELRELLAFSMVNKASDVHLASGSSPRMRIQGDLEIMPDMEPFSAEEVKKIIYSGMDKNQQQEFERKLELDFALHFPSLAHFRVNVFYQAQGISAAYRIIPQEIPSLEQLELPTLIKKLLDLPQGLILVTGPTGSGKSTTLAAMVNYLNVHHAYHIITIEDPIEFTHKNKRSLINQRQVHRDTHDFSAALRAALREDPDVILVGEMRDLETIRLALTAAETGHLVLATLHASSASRTVNRIVDVFPVGEKNTLRNLLSESLQAVICQTLVKKISGTRVAALEIMLVTPAIRHLIREDKIAQLYATIQTTSHMGMCTLDQYLQKLVHKKVILPLIAHEVAVDKTLFSME